MLNYKMHFISSKVAKDELTMPIPDYQSIMLPLLKLVNDQQEHSLREAIGILADQFQLTKKERKELLPSGKQALFNNRVAWASTYLRKAGLLESSKRGIFKITDRGTNVLDKSPKEIDVQFLKQYREFIDFYSSKKSDDSGLGQTGGGDEPIDEKNPEETLEYSYQKIRNGLASELY